MFKLPSYNLKFFKKTNVFILSCSSLNIQMETLFTVLFSLGSVQFSSFQSLSHVWFLVTLWIAACQASLSITNSQSSHKPMSIKSVMPSSHLILCRPLLLLPSVFPSFRVFYSKSALCIRWPEYWSFSFSISPSNEDSGLISFRMDWLDLLAAQGTLNSLLQHYSWKVSVLRCSVFFMVQLSHLYITTGKNHGFDYMDLCQQRDVSAFEYIF